MQNKFTWKYYTVNTGRLTFTILRRIGEPPGVRGILQGPGCCSILVERGSPRQSLFNYTDIIIFDVSEVCISGPWCNWCVADGNDVALHIYFPTR